MMSAQRAQYLLKYYGQWARAVHHVAASSSKVVQSNYPRQCGVLNPSLRAFCTKPIQKAAKENSSEQEDGDLSSVFERFKKIQQDAGMETDAAPPSQVLEAPQMKYLKQELSAVAADWKELAQVIDGQNMKASAMLRFVEENLSSAPYSVVCKLVTMFCQVFDENSKQLQLVLDEGVSRMADETLLQALFFVNTLNHLPDDKVHSRFFELCLEKMKVKLSDDITPVELVFALSVLRKNKMPELQDLLDTITIQKLDKMTLENLIDLFHIKALQRQRNPTLIHGIVRNLIGCDFSELTLQQLTNLFYSCGSLKVFNQHLLQNASKQMVNNLKNQRKSVSIVRSSCHSVLFSCKVLHWTNIEMMQEISRLLRKGMGSAKPKDVMEDIVSLCYLGYKRADIVGKFSGNAKQLKEADPVRWLTYTHATAAVELAKLEDIKEAVNPDFFQPLLDNATGPMKSYIMRMLLNLQGCLEVDFGVTDAPFSQADLFGVQTWQVTRGKNALAYAVEAALKYVSSDISPGRYDKYGHRIDFDVKVPDKTNPGSESVTTSIRILEFNEMVQGSETGATTTGPNAMALRHLQAQSTPLMILPYYKWKTSEMSIENAAKLETLLQETVKASTQTTQTQANTDTPTPQT